MQHVRQKAAYCCHLKFVQEEETAEKHISEMLAHMCINFRQKKALNYLRRYTRYQCGRNSLNTSTKITAANPNRI
jgi:hypothetical protein